MECDYFQLLQCPITIPGWMWMHRYMLENDIFKQELSRFCSLKGK